MIHRQPSIWETCSVPAAAMSRPRQHCTRQPVSILHLRRLGIISVTCSTIKGDPKPPSNACARRCRSRLTTATQCSTWLCCCNEQISVQRREIIGGAISLSTANLNGLAAHADHSNSVRCSSIGPSEGRERMYLTDRDAADQIHGILGWLCDLLRACSGRRTGRRMVKLSICFRARDYSTQP